MKHFQRVFGLFMFCGFFWSTSHGVRILDPNPCGPRLCQLLCDRLLGCTHLQFQHNHLTCVLNIIENTLLLEHPHSKSKDVHTDSLILEGELSPMRFITTKYHGHTCAEVETKKIRFEINAGEYHALVRHACMNGEVEILKCLMSRGLVDTEYPFMYSRTPVMKAARFGQKVVFDYLVEQHCLLELRDFFDNSLLHEACIGGNVAIVKRLVEEFKFDVDLLGHMGRTPVLSAAVSGHIAVSEYLLSRSCKISILTELGENALHLACASGNLDMVMVMMTWFRSEDKDKNGRTALIHSVLARKPNVFFYLVDNGSNVFGNDGRTAATNVWVTDRYSMTVLHYACYFDELLMVVEKLLVAYKYDIEVKGAEDLTPFLVSVRQNAIKIMSYLIKRGCDMSAVDSHGRNAVDLAKDNNNSNIVNILVKKYNFKSKTTGLSQAN